MQNPIYSGVNRVCLECQKTEFTPPGLCNQLTKMIEQSYRLPVEQKPPTDNDNINGLRPLGVLTLRLESSVHGQTKRVRLVWQNANQSASRLGKVVGNWITISSPNDPKLTARQLAERLLETSPR